MIVEMLSGRLRDTMAVIVRYFDDQGCVPTRSQIVEGMGLHGQNTTGRRLKVLRKLGYIADIPGRAGFRIVRDVDGRPVRARLLLEETP